MLILEEHVALDGHSVHIVKTRLSVRKMGTYLPSMH